MSPAEKLALARRSYAAFNAGLGIETLIPLYHPDCEWRIGSGDAGGTSAPRGHAGLREWKSGLDERQGYEAFTAMIDQARITREGALLLRFRGSGRSGGADVSIAAAWQKVEFREDLICTTALFLEPPPGWDQATPIA